jgi:hypothetical protein
MFPGSKLYFTLLNWGAPYDYQAMRLGHKDLIFDTQKFSSGGKICLTVTNSNQLKSAIFTRAAFMPDKRL